MENKKKEIAEFYGQILSDQKLKEKIVEDAKRITNEEDLKKLIRKEIMPLTKKYNVNFSEEELLSYEQKRLKELSEDMLEEVSGGVSLKPALLTGGVLAMALFGGIGLSSSIASADSGKGSGVQTQRKTTTSSTSNNDNDSDNNNNNDNDNNNLDNGNDNANAEKELLKNAVNQQLESSEGHNLISESKMDMYRSEKARNGLAVAVGGEGIFSYISALSGGVVLTDCYSNVYKSETLIIPSEVLTQDGDKLIVVGIGGEENFRNSNFKTIKINSSTEEFTFEEGSFLGNKHIKTVDCSNATGLKKLVVSDGAFENSSVEKFLPPEQPVVEIIIADDALTGAPIEQYKAYSAPSMFRSFFNKATSISTYVLNKVKSIINLACIGKEYRADFAADLNNAIENSELNSLEQTDRELLLNADSLMRNESYNSQINVQQNAEEEQNDNNNNQELKEIVSAGENNVMNVQQNVDKEEQKPEILLSSSGNENTDEASQEVQVEAQLEEKNEDTQETQNQLEQLEEEISDIVRDAETKQEDQSEENDKESGNEDNNDSDNANNNKPTSEKVNHKKKKSGTKKRSTERSKVRKRIKRIKKTKMGEAENSEGGALSSSENEDAQEIIEQEVQKRLEEENSDIVQDDEIKQEDQSEENDKESGNEDNDDSDNDYKRTPKTKEKAVKGLGSKIRKNRNKDQKVENDDEYTQTESKSKKQKKKVRTRKRKVKLSDLVENQKINVDQNGDGDDQKIDVSQNDNNIQEFEGISSEKNNDTDQEIIEDQNDDNIQERKSESSSEENNDADQEIIEDQNDNNIQEFEEDSSEENNNGIYTLDKDGGLDISGTGAIGAYKPGDDDEENSYKSVKEITIGPNITDISGFNFSDFLLLKEIKVDSNNQNYMSIDGVLYSKDGSKLIRYPKYKRDIAFNIPTTVVEIMPHAFAKARIKAVNIPDSVKKIGASAFTESRITYVSIPGSVEVIEEQAFYKCKNLSSIKFSEGLRKIENRAFADCSLTHNIGYNNWRTALLFPNSLETIGEESFSGNVRLNGVKLGTGIKNIGKGAFYNCEKLQISNPGAVNVVIGDNAFYGCAKISPQDFADYEEYEEEQTSETKSSVNYNNINNEINFDVDTYRAENQPSKRGELGQANSWELYKDGTLILLGKGEAAPNKNWNRNPWDEHEIKRVIVSHGITKISGGMFLKHPELKSVIIAGTVEEIDENAFFGCSRLGSVYFQSSGIEKIGEMAFQGCVNLENINIPHSVKKIEQGAFYGCKILAHIDLSNVEEIGAGAFKGSNIGTVNLNNVEKLGKHAFGDCINLSYVNFGNNNKLTKIEENTFEKTLVKNVVLPYSVKEVQMGKFENYNVYVKDTNSVKVVHSNSSNASQIKQSLFY